MALLGQASEAPRSRRHVVDARSRRGRLWQLLVFALGIVAILSILSSPAMADEPPRLHEARFVYYIDRSRVPSWATMRTTTLVVDVGPALDAIAFADGFPVPCLYDGQRALITTDADEVDLFVTAPSSPLEEMGDVSLATLRDDKLWALSITLDDGYASQATTGKAFLDRYGYAASIAVIGSCIGKTTGGHTYATAEQLQSVVDSGWHLANHTDTHQWAADMGVETDVVRNVRAANDHIMAAVPGYRPLMFTSPFVDPDFAPIIKAHVDELGLQLIQSLGWEARQVDHGVFSADDSEPYTLGRTQLLYNGSQFSGVYELLASSPGSHWWLSLHSHEVAPECDCVEIATDVLHSRYGAGGANEVWVAPAPEVYQYLVVRDRARVSEKARLLIGEAPEGFSLPPRDPAPTRRAAILQYGRDGYTGTRDAYIDAWHVHQNYGESQVLAVRTFGVVSSLIRFDVSQVPEEALVERATLRLYGLRETNDAIICLNAYPLLRPWDEDAATWQQPRTNETWGTAGADHPGVDRAAEVSGLRGLVEGVDHWYDIEIADAVQGWVANPESNHGLVITSSGEAAKQVTMSSSEYYDLQRRPSLVITYALPIPQETVPPMEGDGLLQGTLLLEGRGEPPSGSWSVPITAALDQAEDGAKVYTEHLVTDEHGEFTLNDLSQGTYDLTLTGAHALPVVRKGLTVHPGDNGVALGPLVEGDIVADGYVDARDWAELVRAFDTGLGDAAYSAQADLNDDGEVDVLDAAMLCANYGRYGDVIQTTDPSQPPMPHVSDASIWITPANGQGKVGETTTFTVMLDTGGQPAHVVDLCVEFDPAYMELVVASPSGGFSVPLPGSQLHSGDGWIRYLATNPGSPASGSLSLLQLSFAGKRPTPPQGTGILVGADGGHLSRVVSGGYDVLGSVADASVIVHSAKALYFPYVPQGEVRDRGATRELARTDYDGAQTLPIVGSYPLPGPPIEARDVRVRGDYAYVVLATFYESWSFVHILDVTDPTAPRFVSAVNGVARDPDEIFLEGDRAYVPKKGLGVDILDITDPLGIRGLGRFLWEIGGQRLAKGVHAVGNRLYVADEIHGLQVVDVTDPTSPFLLGSYPGIFGEGVWSDGVVAYVAADRGQEDRPVVYALDVSRPDRPGLLSLLVPPVIGRAVDVHVARSRLFLAAEDGGLTVYDVSQHETPDYLGTFDTAFAQKVNVVEDIAYVADGRGGLVVVDASDPAAMRALGQCDTPGQAFGVSVAGGYAYVADGTEGLQVIDLAALTPTATATPTPTVTPLPTSTPEPTLPPVPTLAPLAIPFISK